MSITGNLSQVIDLDQKFFDPPWSKTQWDEIDYSHHQLFVFEESNGVQGYALFTAVPGDDIAHLLKILVVPNLQGTLAASRFWAQILENLKAMGFSRVYLEVKATNTRAIGFYQKNGFKTLRKVKSYYSDGTDGVMMQLTT